MNILNESISIPQMPKVARNINYKYKTLELPQEEGGVSFFRVLPSRNSAAAFIVDILRNMSFPMAGSSMKLRDYQSDPEWYKEDMEKWEADYAACDPDTITYFYSRGRLHCIDHEMTLKDAIAALRASEYVENLVQTNDGDSVLYNGIIYYDETVGLWYSDIDKPRGWEDYNWNDVYGTLVEVLAGVDS